MRWKSKDENARLLLEAFNRLVLNYTTGVNVDNRNQKSTFLSHIVISNQVISIVANNFLTLVGSSDHEREGGNTGFQIYSPCWGAEAREQVPAAY